MSPRKVTVVIPTRERPDTLVHCLKTALNQDYKNLEVIVSDNFSAPATERAVRSIGDPRVRYLNTGRRLSMSHNFEFALSHVNEGWIVVVGDDDGLLPNSLGRAVGVLERSGLEALSSYTCGYNWPSSWNAERGSASVLSVPLTKGERRVNAKDALTRIMNWKMHSLVLPALYTGGIVSAELFKRIKSKKGAFFQSQIPDVYSGFAICSVVDEYLFTRAPFAISGASKHTNAALFRLERTPFVDEDNIPFHRDIPLPQIGFLNFSLPAMIYESYLQSLFLHGGIPEATPAHQLELILAHTSEARQILPEWGKQFAAHHGLDYTEIAARSERKRLDRRISEWRSVMANLHSRFRIDTSLGLPISTVFEASIVADAVLRLRPSRLPSYYRTFRRTVLRSIKGGALQPQQSV